MTGTGPPAIGQRPPNDCESPEIRTFLEAVTLGAGVFIATIDQDFRCLRVNGGYQRWFGMSSQEIRRRHVREVLGEVVWERVRGYLQQAMVGEMVSYEEELLYHRGRESLGCHRPGTGSRY